MVMVERPCQGVVASQGRGDLTGLAVCRGRGLGVRARAGSAVVASKEVVAVAGVEGAVPRAEVMATASAVPRRPPRKETMIPRRPEVVPAERAKEVVARGSCHGPRR